MAEILHQLIGKLSHYSIYRVSYIPGGAGFLPSTVLKSSPIFFVFFGGVKMKLSTKNLNYKKDIQEI